MTHIIKDLLSPNANDKVSDLETTTKAKHQCLAGECKFRILHKVDTLAEAIIDVLKRLPRLYGEIDILVNSTNLQHTQPVDEYFEGGLEMHAPGHIHSSLPIY